MGSKPPAALAIWRRIAEVRLWDWTSTIVNTGLPGAPSHARATTPVFHPQFKAQVVLGVLSGQRSASEAARLHKLKPQLISRWKGIALEGLEGLFEGDDQRSRDQHRIAELERMVGRLTMELEVAKKVSTLLPSALRRDGRSS